MTKETRLSVSVTEACLRRRFKEFSRQESPERGWLLFERPTKAGGGVSERVTFSISASNGAVKIVPSAELRFDRLALLDAFIWEDPKRADWHMPSGLKCYLAEFSATRGQSWVAGTTFELDKVALDIAAIFDTHVAPVFKSMSNVESICDWYDQKPSEVLIFAPELVVASMNLLAARYNKAAEMAEACLVKSRALPSVSNEQTMTNRRRYETACGALLVLARAERSGVASIDVGATSSDVRH